MEKQNLCVSVGDLQTILKMIEDDKKNYKIATPLEHIIVSIIRTEEGELIWNTIQ